MIGRKLGARLAADGAIAGRQIKSVHLVDVVAPPARRRRLRRALRGARPRRAVDRGKVDRGAPGRRLSPRGCGLGRGGERFRQGLRGQSRRDAPSVRGDSPRARPRRRRLSPAAGLRLVDRRFRRAFSRDDRRRFPRRPAHQLRRAEGDRRAAHRRLFAPRTLRWDRVAPADGRRQTGAGQPRRLRLLFVDHSRAALGREAILPAPEATQLWCASPRAAVGFFSTPPPSTSTGWVRGAA